MVIKPSGIEYDKMSLDDVVVADIESGLRVEGKWNPSSDTKTHLALYRKFSKQYTTPVFSTLPFSAIFLLENKITKEGSHGY